MKELGDYLKQTRIEKGVALTEACEDLELSTSQIENIESGNVRAFKDVYELRNLVKAYAKYLGLDSEKVLDEFSGFLFQHTSKISLDDIKNAQQNRKLVQKKIKSPYTKTYNKKISIWPFFIGMVSFVILIFVLYLIISAINKSPARVNELKSIVKECNYNEFTY